MLGICKLCEHEKELKRSHILPEFMYQNIYDHIPHRFNKLMINFIEPDLSKHKFEQKGIREFLLCGDCEVFLSKYENYAAETIYGKNKKTKAYILKQCETIDLQYSTHDIVGLSYNGFKIFLLSILWRIIISKSFSSPDIDRIDSGIKEKIRQAIYNQDPLDSDDFGCLLQVIKYKKGQIAKKFIIGPYVTKNRNDTALHILIDGFLYSFNLNSKDSHHLLKTFFLKPDGTMKLLGRRLSEHEFLFKNDKSNI